MLISPRCYSARLEDGRKVRIPVSHLAGSDKDYPNGDYFWVASWLLKREGVEISKECQFDETTKKRKSVTITRRHKPLPVAPIDNNKIKDLQK